MNAAYHLIDYTLHLADTNLILSQRNAEWCGHGPILEQDIALTNIALDLLGQSRNFYQYAAGLINIHSGYLIGAGISPYLLPRRAITEDNLAYLRTERVFKNLLMVELPKGDWAQTILRQFLYSSFQQLAYVRLREIGPQQLRAIAEKSLKETNYHLKWSGEWVIRLGDGTPESRQRMLKAIVDLWPYTGEFFIPAPYETVDVTGFEPASLKQQWLVQVAVVLKEATIWKETAQKEEKPGVFMHKGGKTGIHTEHMGYVLAEMQYLQRTYPGAEW